MHRHKNKINQHWAASIHLIRQQQQRSDQIYLVFDPNIQIKTKENHTKAWADFHQLQDFRFV